VTPSHNKPLQPIASGDGWASTLCEQCVLEGRMQDLIARLSLVVILSVLSACQARDTEIKACAEMPITATEKLAGAFPGLVDGEIENSELFHPRKHSVLQETFEAAQTCNLVLINQMDRGQHSRYSEWYISLSSFYASYSAQYELMQERSSQSLGAVEKGHLMRSFDRLLKIREQVGTVL